MEKLKINYHITENCNFNCKFCFAKYADKTLKLENQKLVIEKIADSMLFDAINFAGGEPLLDKNIVEHIQYSSRLGLKTSLITNGFLLDSQTLQQILPYLTMIGISVHTFDNETKRKIGSCTSSGEVLENQMLVEICNMVRSYNSQTRKKCKIKINTVICSENKQEILKKNIEPLQIDRWKCLRCQEFCKNQNYLVNDTEYKAFAQRNTLETETVEQVFEDDMKDTYIMINPEGKLLREGADNRSYDEIGSVLEKDISDLLNVLPLKKRKYFERYKQ